jgi:hypothetical protein
MTPDTTKAFNDFYEVSGLVESDISPELLKKAYDAGFTHGWQSAKLVEPEKHGVVYRRKGNKGNGVKVKPDDPRPATEAQQLFIRNLLKKSSLSKDELIDFLRGIGVEADADDIKKSLTMTITMGQASQLIDKLR